ncbi:hypothetical protein C1646_760372 [Rhizophagus diaphanus]|nr:hypothetical protein C1646_760372 [Rhizophagus diaphanus] [Rhizophagus sp. MUCL 43196]
MSIKQYFKTKMPSENIEFDNNESSKKVQLLSKRKTGVFQNEWLNIYKWLIYDGSRYLMFCSLCQSHKKQNKFGKEAENDISLNKLLEVIRLCKILDCLHLLSAFNTITYENNHQEIL